MSKSQEILSRKDAAVSRGVATRRLTVSRALNAELWDADGRRFIDLAVGIAVNNTGHRHPKVLAAVQEQLGKFTHTSFGVVPFESYVSLAERLNKLTPGDFSKKTIFLTSGSEAVENAVKMARAYTNRSGVVAFNAAFHGRTLLGMSLTGKVAGYKYGFGAMAPEIHHAAFPHEFHGVTVEESLRDLRRLMATTIDPERIAAFIIEPVQGEGGFYAAPPEFLQALREIANQHGIVLIADEIQSGIGRTGKMFAMEHSGVVADLVVMAKGLAGGFPLSGVTGRAEIIDAPEVGGLGGTYAGPPVGIAAAHAVLDVLEEEGLCARSDEIGKKLKTSFRQLSEHPDLDCIGDVRGLGAMVALEFVTDTTTNAPDPKLMQQVVVEAENRGLIVLACGVRENVIRLLPPLTIEIPVLEEAIQILSVSIEVVQRKEKAARDGFAKKS